MLEVAVDMRTQFDSLSDEFKLIDAVNRNFVCDADGWLLQNPMGIRLEREIHAELEGSKNLQADVCERKLTIFLVRLLT